MSHPQPRHAAPPTLRSLAAGTVVLALLLAAILRFCILLYALPVNFPPVLGLCLAGVALSTAIWALPRYRAWAVILVLVVAGVAVYHNQADLLSGVRACGKALAYFWDQHTAPSPTYPMPDPRSSLLYGDAAQLVMGGTFALLALPLGWAVHRLRRFWPVFALTLPWLLPAFVSEVPLDWPDLALICACWAALLLSALVGRANPNGGARLALLSLPLSLALMGGVFLLYPVQSYTTPDWVAQLRSQLESQTWFPGQEGVPGAASDPHPEPQAPQLDFSSAGPRSYTGRGILQVSTSQPGSLYLRGEVYRDYTPQGWSGLEPQSTGELELSSGSPRPTSAFATVTHLTARSSTPYLPYRTQLVNQLHTHPDTPLAFPQALKEYTVYYSPLVGEPSLQGVVSHEPARDDAYENYLDVPEEVYGPLLEWWTQAMEELEESGEPVRAVSSGDYAPQLNTAALMAQLLARGARYDLDTPITPQEEDFVTYFLEESRQGYCVHFASAATLLFRLQGIPARYVSGYATTVPAVSAQGTGRYTTRVLDSDAHAWVEIYLDGYGWYPVEVTPTSTAARQPVQTSAPSASPTATPAPTPAQPSAAPTQAPLPTPSLPPHSQEGELSLAGLGWLLPLPVLGLALYLAYRVRAGQWRKMCRGGDPNAAVLAAYRWLGQLERLGGGETPEVLALAQKARFSAHTLTPQERLQVLDHLRGEVARLRQTAPVWKRWLLGLLFPTP